MKLSRETELKIKFFLEQLIPPLIRDAKWFNILPFNILFKNKSRIFWQFKQKGLRLTDKQFKRTYQQVDSVLFTKETDLSQKSIQEILKNIEGKTVLEVGCGKGFLAKILSKQFKVTACDIVIDSKLIQQNPKIYFRHANIEKLPFKDKQFDTVVTTHTLEHVQNIFAAISQLRRVTKKRLIIIVPKERPYKYTFNLHLHFFPYPHSLLALMGSGIDNTCYEVGGDLFYMERV